MKDGEDAPQQHDSLSIEQLAAAELATPTRLFPQVLGWAFVRLRAVDWRRFVLRVGLVLHPLVVYAICQSTDIGQSVLEQFFQSVRSGLGVQAFF